MTPRRSPKLRPAIARLLVVAAFAVLAVLAVLQLEQLRTPPAPPPVHHGATLPYHDSFQYIINGDVCADAPVTAVIVVHSDPRHPEMRRAIRRSLPSRLLRSLGLRRAFMLAEVSHRVTAHETVVPQHVIDKESADNRDVVQGNFHDSYHNLTYKHIMALDWASTFCPQARKIIKMDDDIVYDVFQLLKVLALIPDTNYLGGNIFYHAAPFRGDSKWRVSLQDWPRSVYPPYLSGWLYIVTPDVARSLVLESTVVPFFWIDDTYVTGILAEQIPIRVRGFKTLFVTTSECIKYTVHQDFSLAAESDHDIFLPGFLVGPTDKDLAALEKFNELTRYCANHTCHTRTRFRLCQNRF